MQFAAVFPGQGSQSLGMLAELATEYKEVKETFEQASDILNTDLWKMIHADSADAINQTINTQPIMLAAGIAVWRIWQKGGGCKPVAMAGHSLGEYSALVASEVLNFDDAVSLVSTRAHLMQEAVPVGTGAMAAILGLEDQRIIDECEKLANVGVVEAVNFNSPGQVVIAGESDAVEAAVKKLSEVGAKRAVRLAMSVPSHCSLLKDASVSLSEALATVTFNEALFPVVQNAEAINHENLSQRQSALAEQLYKPVLWVDTIQHLSGKYEADTIIEFGPGKVLFGLNRRIDRILGNICISDLTSLDKALAMCQE